MSHFLIGLTDVIVLTAKMNYLFYMKLGFSHFCIMKMKKGNGIESEKPMKVTVPLTSFRGYYRYCLLRVL